MSIRPLFLLPDTCYSLINDCAAIVAVRKELYMKTFTIFYNTENPLYLKMDEPEAFIAWLENINAGPVFIYDKKNTTYYIYRDKINYVVAS